MFGVGRVLPSFSNNVNNCPTPPFMISIYVSHGYYEIFDVVIKPSPKHLTGHSTIERYTLSLRLTSYLLWSTRLQVTTAD